MPLELGSREGGLVLVLKAIKISSPLGIYLGLVNRIREFFWIFVGLVLIASSGKTIGKNLTESVDYEKSTFV
jgi:hypothetical protein